MCGGVDRFWINVKKQAFACRKCGVGGDVIALVMHADAVSFGEAVAIILGDGDESRPARRTPAAPAIEEPTRDARDKNQLAARLWSMRQRVEGTVAETYLRRARGVSCPLPPTLGFLPAYRGGPPRMIAAFGPCREVDPGVIVPPSVVATIHSTFLRTDGGGKAREESLPTIDGVPLGPKFITGPGCADPIVLAPPNDLLGLAITEGIEDALSVHEATGMGAWAAGTAGQIPKVARLVPKWVECVTLFEHPDKDGRRKVEEAAEMLIDRKIEVYVVEGSGR